MADSLIAHQAYSHDEVLFDFRSDLHIAHVVLNRPHVLNAINTPLLTALVDSLKRVKVVEKARKLFRR